MSISTHLPGRCGDRRARLARRPGAT